MAIFPLKWSLMYFALLSSNANAAPFSQIIVPDDSWVHLGQQNGRRSPQDGLPVDACHPVTLQGFDEHPGLGEHRHRDHVLDDVRVKSRLLLRVADEQVLDVRINHTLVGFGIVVDDIAVQFSLVHMYVPGTSPVVECLMFFPRGKSVSAKQ